MANQKTNTTTQGEAARQTNIVFLQTNQPPSLQYQKLVKRTVQKQVMKFMTDSGQLNDDHSAYRAGHSTVTTLLQITEALHKATDENMIANIRTVDDSTAFDCISHTILDRNLELYKFSESSRKWFKNFLSHQTQYVLIGSRRSSMRKVVHRVLQGSVLGLLLFTIYVNELPMVLQ